MRASIGVSSRRASAPARVVEGGVLTARHCLRITACGDVPVDAGRRPDSRGPMTVADEAEVAMAGAGPGRRGRRGGRPEAIRSPIISATYAQPHERAKAGAERPLRVHPPR